MPQKWYKEMMKQRHQEHVQRMKDMQSTVDNKTPRELPVSLKKEIERRKFQEKIEAENRLVLDRLAKAMAKKNIDNDSPRSGFPSLTEVQRRLELHKISVENRDMLSRIQSVEPSCNRLEWERASLEREKTLRNMTEFPDYYVPKYKPRVRVIRQQAQKSLESNLHSSSEKQLFNNTNNTYNTSMNRNYLSFDSSDNRAVIEDTGSEDLEDRDVLPPLSAPSPYELNRPYSSSNKLR